MLLLDLVIGGLTFSWFDLFEIGERGRERGRERVEEREREGRSLDVCALCVCVL